MRIYLYSNVHVVFVIRIGITCLITLHIIYKMYYFSVRVLSVLLQNKHKIALPLEVRRRLHIPGFHFYFFFLAKMVLTLGKHVLPVTQKPKLARTVTLVRQENKTNKPCFPTAIEYTSSYRRIYIFLTGNFSIALHFHSLIQNKPKHCAERMTEKELHCPQSDAKQQSTRT